MKRLVLLAAAVVLGLAALAVPPTVEANIPNCSTTCTPHNQFVCRSTGGFCGYNPDTGGCGCVYP